MKESIPKSVIRNRRNKIKEYTSEYNLTIEILADCFQVPLRVISADIKAIKETEPDFKLQNEGLKTFCVYLQKEKMRNEVNNHIEEFDTTSREWSCVGFWIEAKHFGEECKKMFREISDIHKRSLLQRAYSMLKMGYTLDDVRLICSLKKVDMEILRAEIKDEKFENLFDRWAYWQYKDKEQSNVDDIKAAVGASKTKLLRGDMYYYSRKKEESNLPKSVYKARESKEDLEYKKEQAFCIWNLGGLKQDEIAAIFDVTRVTVGNWIREMKLKHPEEVKNDKNRRNVDINRRGQRREDMEIFSQQIKPQLSEGRTKAEVSKETGFNSNKILKFERMKNGPFITVNEKDIPVDPMKAFRVNTKRKK